MAGASHPRVDLLGHELTALAGLGALGHLDLQVLGVGQVQARDPEAPGGDLLDLGAALRVHEPLDVLAALARVRLGADPVHGDGQGLVGLHGDRPVGHGAGGEPLEDLLDRLDLLERDRSAVRVEGQQAADGLELLGLLVDQPRVGAEDVVAARAGRVLQPEDDLRAEQVRGPVAAPVVLAAGLQSDVRLHDTVLRVGPAMARVRLLGDDVQAHAVELGDGSREEVLDQLAGQAQGLEGLGSAVGGDGRDAHLGHDLLHALAQSLDEVGDRLLLRDPDDLPGAHEVLGGLHGQVWVHARGAVAQQQGHVVDFADVAGLDHERALGASGRAQQMVVDRAGEQQRGDRRPGAVRVAVGDHDVLHAAVDGRRDLLADLRDARPQARSPALGAVEAAHLEGDRHLVLIAEVQDLVELVVVDDGELEDHLVRADALGGQQIAHGPQRAPHGGHKLLADRVQRRIRHLGEGLHEVVEEQARALGQHGHRGVGAHGVDGLGALLGHGADDLGELLVGVAEGLLPQLDRRARVAHVLALGQIREAHSVALGPLLPRLQLRDLLLELGVLHDPALDGVHQEHGARGHAALAHDRAIREVDHADLRGEDDQPVLGLPEAAGAQPVAVEHRAHASAVGEGHGGGPVPRLHERGVVLVEGAPVGVHGLVVLPGLRDHHHHGLHERAAREHEQLGDLVEGLRVRGALGADREQLLGIAAQQRGLQLRLARAHPVAVALDGVDLAVVRQDPHGLGQRPRRERVGREARVHHRQPRAEALIREIRVEGLELGRGEHALVDDGRARERRAVDAQPVLRPLAQAEGLLIELQPGGRAVQVLDRDVPGERLLGIAALLDEELDEVRHDGAGRAADRGIVHGDLAPAEDLEPLRVGDLLHLRADLRLVPATGGQEHRAHGVGARCGQLDVEHLAEEGVGDLQENARAVAGAGVAADGAAVLEGPQRDQRLVHDLVAGLSVQGGDHGQAAGVLLLVRAVEALLLRGGRELGERRADGLVRALLRRLGRGRLGGLALAQRGRTSPGVGSGLRHGVLLT